MPPTEKQAYYQSLFNKSPQSAAAEFRERLEEIEGFLFFIWDILSNKSELRSDTEQQVQYKPHEIESKALLFCSYAFHTHPSKGMETGTISRVVRLDGLLWKGWRCNPHGTSRVFEAAEGSKSNLIRLWNHLVWWRIDSHLQGKVIRPLLLTRCKTCGMDPTWYCPRVNATELLVLFACLAFLIQTTRDTITRFINLEEACVTVGIQRHGIQKGFARSILVSRRTLTHQRYYHCR